MSALDDLKKLVMEGLLEKEVEIPFQDKKFKFTLGTITMLEELKVMADAELTSMPKTDMETMRYIMAVLPYAIKKINGEAVVHDMVKDVIGLMSGELIGELYGAYIALHTKELKAGEELKNS